MTNTDNESSADRFERDMEELTGIREPEEGQRDAEDRETEKEETK